MANEAEEDFTFPATITNPPLCLLESPPLWPPVSRSEEEQWNFNLYSVQELKRRSITFRENFCYVDDCEEEKMDILWEDLNEKFSRSGLRKNIAEHLCENGRDDDDDDDVQVCCVKLSKANGEEISWKKASILVLIRLLFRKSFAMHDSGPSISKLHWLGMLGRSLASPLLTFDSTAHLCNHPDSAAVTTSKLVVNANLSTYTPQNAFRGGLHATASSSKRWELNSTAQTQDVILSEEDKKTWESCRQALSAFGFDHEDKDKILGKAFGQIHSPYWGEDRVKEVPKFEVVREILSYLKDLGLTDDDIGKLLKKFPEVLGCSLENELKANVQILDKQWGIKGKTLRSLLLRNPKALGYNIDCKGDCMAQCTRCWVRF